MINVAKEHIPYLKDFIERWENAKNEKEEEKLSDEYSNFIMKHNYPLYSAEELLFEAI